MPSQNNLDTVQPFIGEKETAINAQSNEVETFLLTDRRLFSVRASGGDTERTLIDTLHLDLVGGTKIEQQKKPDLDQETVGYGILSIVIGFVSFAAAAGLEGSLMGLMLVIGFGVGLMGIILVIEGYSAADGNVTIKLQSESGDVMQEIRLGEDQLAFGEAISRAVSNNITQPDEVSRKVGN
ncbi:hypothetical protein [Natronorubrum sp. FCH18a]|uniref:hypothetical protein n=1 Tax=Natronorubrum sp. FCH18a TaxID=3447018 RepID=UPI003F517094